MLAAEGGWVVCGDMLGAESTRMGCMVCADMPGAEGEWVACGDTLDAESMRMP